MPLSRVVLALGVQVLVAEKAVPAGDVEGDDDAVARRYVLHVRPYLFDDAHGLVADDVALAHEGRELGVKVQVGAADGGGGYADDGVGGLLDDRVGDVVHPDVFLAVPDYGLQGSLPPTPVSISRIRKGPPVFGESGGVSRPARGPQASP